MLPHLKRDACFVFLATALLAGCRPPHGSPATPVSAGDPPVTPQVAAATASVIAVRLGRARDSDSSLEAPLNLFHPDDTIVAEVATRTADAAASVRARLGARWTRLATGQVINEENEEKTLLGDETAYFRIVNPQGWHAGAYRLEILLDNTVVQAREYEVR